MEYYFSYNFDFGEIFISEKDNKIISVQMNASKNALKQETKLIKDTFKQINEYFAGKRKVFDISYSFIGTDFQTKVWKALAKIPYAKTCTYKQIAEKISKPKAYRAVGQACNKNPLLIIVPCHRVIGSNGKLTGFALGENIKKYLLDLELKKV